MRLGPALLLARRCLGGGSRPGEELPGRRYLRGAILGVALSLVPLVVVLVVADGMIEGITRRYIEAGSYHMQAQPLARASPAALEEQAAILRELPGIAAAFPEIQGAAVALAGSRSGGALLRAVDPRFLSDPGTLQYLRLVQGSLELAASNEIILGESLARSLDAHPGDIVSVVTARIGPGTEGLRLSPKVSAFRVKGVVSAGYQQLDALWAFVSVKAGARALSPENSLALVGLKVEDPFGDLADLRGEALLRLPPDWAVTAWPEINRNLYRSFATTRSLLLLVMALAVAVAAVNVGSALSMLAIERRRDIAILKSAGATRPFIATVFVLAGLATGGAGTAAGLTLGSLIAWRVNDIIALIEGAINWIGALASGMGGGTAGYAALKLLDPAYYLERIPAAIEPASLIAVAAASLALCLIASILPAWRAASLPPLEIFRKT